jgi:outer membrane protein assembly factor BamA
LVFRSFLGVAIPYGNSNTIPFSRSYFIGGPNDLRAWKIYDLGPGSTKSGLEFNVGNLKFINSLEYRFNIVNSINGALFVDAGNIWDISNTPITEPEAKFNGFSSLKDVAIGSGFGLRYDLSFILLRLDLGFKTYEPYLPEGDKWFKNYNMGHAVYNFGISYPF